MNCFSQTNTKTTITPTPVIDTTKVKIKPPTARAAIKDIIRGEGCEKELKLTQEKLIKTEEREKQKDTVIVLLTEKDKNNNYMLGKKDEQLKTSGELTDSLKNDLRKVKTTSFFYKLGTFVGVITTSYLLIVR